jgi:hypothetical protein
MRLVKISLKQKRRLIREDKWRCTSLGSSRRLISTSLSAYFCCVVQLSSFCCGLIPKEGENPCGLSKIVVKLKIMKVNRSNHLVHQSEFLGEERSSGVKRVMVIYQLRELKMTFMVYFELFLHNLPGRIV